MALTQESRRPLVSRPKRLLTMGVGLILFLALMWLGIEQLWRSPIRGAIAAVNSQDFPNTIQLNIGESQGVKRGLKMEILALNDHHVGFLKVTDVYPEYACAKLLGEPTALLQPDLKVRERRWI